MSDWKKMGSFIEMVLFRLDAIRRAELHQVIVGGGE